MNNFDIQYDVKDNFKGQTQMSAYLKKDGEILAYADISLVKNKVYIDHIKAIKRGYGYGTELMKSLADKFGYENLIRTSLTPDGAKMRKKLDSYFNFDYESWLRNQSMHIKPEEIQYVKNPTIKKFLKIQIFKGYESGWDWLMGHANDLEDLDVRYDLNEVSDIAEWVYGSTENNNPDYVEPPDHVIKKLKELQ